jgi:hypothetical protein
VVEALGAGVVVADVVCGPAGLEPDAHRGPCGQPSRQCPGAPGAGGFPARD